MAAQSDVEKFLISKSPVFQGNDPGDMDFRKPESLTPFRGLYRHPKEADRFKFIAGLEVVKEEARRVLCAAGIDSIDCEGPQSMFCIEFRIQEAHIESLPK